MKGREQGRGEERSSGRGGSGGRKGRGEGGRGEEGYLARAGAAGEGTTGGPHVRVTLIHILGVARDGGDRWGPQRWSSKSKSRDESLSPPPREVTSRVPSRDESSDSDLLTSEQFSSPRDSLVYS